MASMKILEALYRVFEAVSMSRTLIALVFIGP
jgi:hypothetical protein